jgi:antitoxin (DNA-binding transcriptional repressor) of toxin-antitoxin stability system
VEGHAGPVRLNQMPEVIGLGQLRSDACTYLGRVAAGETLNVVRRGKLVARIMSAGDAVPATTGSVGLDELRTRAGRCFDRVAAGETVYVLRGGKLVARIDARRPA